MSKPADLVHALATAAAAYLSSALQAVGPAAAGLSAAELSVAVKMHGTPAARLVATAPTGEMVLVHQAAGPEFPPALGIAAAAVVESAVAQLQPPTVATLARLQQAGFGQIGLVIGPGHLAVIADSGDVEPMILVTLQPDFGAPQ